MIIGFQWKGLKTILNIYTTNNNNNFKFKMKILKFSGKIWWEKNYDKFSGIKYTNWKKKKKFFSWRGKTCIWTLHIEVFKLKIFVCRLEK